MRSVLLRSLAVIGVGGLVLAGVLFVASTVDARAPQVLAVRPTQPVADDPRHALITTSLEVVFSEPVDMTRAANAVHLEPEVPGAVSWSGSTLIFTPSDPLALDTAYTLTIDEGITDLAGNAMTDVPAPFGFQTAGRPTLVEADPADGAGDVPLDAPITLTFSTLMDTASVESELRLLPSFPHELRWSGELLQIVPSAPLRPGVAYHVTIQDGATDVSGVSLEDPILLEFRTVRTGLSVSQLVPADGIDGIAAISPIAVIFDQPIDPASVDGDSLVITPDVAGTLEVRPLPGNPPADDGSGEMLVFVPSGSLAPNTTYEVQLAATVSSATGGVLAAPTSWSFTTGAPINAVSNQVTFITDRAGIENVWSMNPDGSAARQLSAELSPVIDYAVAPDGSSLVVADGIHLVFQRANGTDRRVMTAEGDAEFDPAYAPDGDHVVFARADRQTGQGHGLWQWTLGGGDPQPIAIVSVPDGAASPSPSGSGSGGGRSPRAPRYSPDGRTLAFIEDGWVGLLNVPAGDVAWIPLAAASPPIWMPDSGAMFLAGRRDLRPTEQGLPFAIPIEPMVGTVADSAFLLDRSSDTATPLPFGPGARPLGVSAAGQIAYVDARGALHIADGVTDRDAMTLIQEPATVGAAFAPGEPSIVAALTTADRAGPVVRVEVPSGRRTELARHGASPRWVP